MDEIVRTFKIFLTRDVTFIIGGASVIGACYYLVSPELNMRPHSWASYLVVLGLGHFVGFALQSFGNFTRVVNAVSLVEPGRFVLTLYRRFTREKTWYAHSPVVEVRFPKYTDERAQAEIDRIITLKRIAATMGSCAVAICVIVVLKCIVRNSSAMVDIFVIASSLSLFGIFSPMSYIMSAAQTQFVVKRTLPDRVRERAYFIWEGDKHKVPEACWMEAQKALHAEAEELLLKLTAKQA